MEIIYRGETFEVDVRIKQGAIYDGYMMPKDPDEIEIRGVEWTGYSINDMLYLIAEKDDRYEIFESTLKLICEAEYNASDRWEFRTFEAKDILEDFNHMNNIIDLCYES